MQIIVWLKYIATEINVMQVCNILRYCTLTKIDAVKETLNTKNTLALTFIRKNKRRSTMRQCLRQKTFVARHYHYVVRRKILAIR